MLCQKLKYKLLLTEEIIIIIIICTVLSLFKASPLNHCICAVKELFNVLIRSSEIGRRDVVFNQSTSIFA